MEDIIQLHDRKFKIMIPAEKIDQAVEAVAQRINADYAGKETPLFLGILTGSFMFRSDLSRRSNSRTNFRSSNWRRTTEPARRVVSKA